jgi:ribosome maturation factor RimP
MSALRDFEDSVLTIAEPILQAAGLDLIEFRVLQRQKTYAIQFIADRPTGGITLEDCALVNRRIIDAMEEDGGFEDADYTLEFSSPGLDRPLRTLKDFRRVIGRPLEIYLNEKYEGKQQYEGVLKGIEEEDLVVDLGEEELLIPIAKVIKGLQIIEEG